jgi:hypothetical protein
MALETQNDVFALGRELVASRASDGGRIGLGASASTSACTTFATLGASNDLFGPQNVNNAAHTLALSLALNRLASATVVTSFEGMAAKETACEGLVLAAAKLLGADAGGSALHAGDSSFRLPTGFGAAIGVSGSAIVETSVRITDFNPYRGASRVVLNGGVTSLTILANNGEGDSEEIPVNKLSQPVLLKMPIASFGSTLLASFTNGTTSFNVSCTGPDRYTVNLRTFER